MTIHRPQNTVKNDIRSPALPSQAVPSSTPLQLKRIVMATSPVPPFLNKAGAIRLLHVTGRDKHGYVNCSDSSMLLGQAGYVAVSYVCGSEHASCITSLENQPFGVRPNLYIFLCYATEHLENVSLWIDTICIDQNNDIPNLIYLATFEVF